MRMRAMGDSGWRMLVEGLLEEDMEGMIDLGWAINEEELGSMVKLEVAMNRGTMKMDLVGEVMGNELQSLMESDILGG